MGLQAVRSSSQHCACPSHNVRVRTTGFAQKTCRVLSVFRRVRISVTLWPGVLLAVTCMRDAIDVRGTCTIHGRGNSSEHIFSACHRKSAIAPPGTESDSAGEVKHAASQRDAFCPHTPAYSSRAGKRGSWAPRPTQLWAPRHSAFMSVAGAAGTFW